MNKSDTTGPSTSTATPAATPGTSLILLTGASGCIGPEKPVWIGGTGTYVDLLTLGEKRVIRGGSWVAPEGSVRSTHRFWNHPLNNSYGVGLGFRCAKTAPPEIDQRIKEASILTYVEMGRKRFAEARHALAPGLALDPKNTELLELRQLIEQSMQRP